MEMRNVTDADLTKFVGLLASNYAAYRERMGYTNPVHDQAYTFTKGPKYAKVWCKRGGDYRHGSIIAFIDTTNGFIYKPAGVNKPAPGVRGSLFSIHEGREALSDTLGGTTVIYAR